MKERPMVGQNAVCDLHVALDKGARVGYVLQRQLEDGRARDGVPADEVADGIYALEGKHQEARARCRDRAARDAAARVPQKRLRVHRVKDASDKCCLRVGEATG